MTNDFRRFCKKYPRLPLAQTRRSFASLSIPLSGPVTLERSIQNYDNLEPLFAFLEEAGLKTGGTGSKVRPVVSCKGTTCQYGLIDTFALSEKLHDLYYTGAFTFGQIDLRYTLADDAKVVEIRFYAVIRTAAYRDLEFVRQGYVMVTGVEQIMQFLKVASLIDGKIQIPTEACNHCGRCVDKCPFGAVTESVTGFLGEGEGVDKTILAGSTFTGNYRTNL